MIAKVAAQLYGQNMIGWTMFHSGHLLQESVVKITEVTENAPLVARAERLEGKFKGTEIRVSAEDRLTGAIWDGMKKRWTT